jgi:hypothetical protein
MGFYTQHIVSAWGMGWRHIDSISVGGNIAISFPVAPLLTAPQVDAHVFIPKDYWCVQEGITGALLCD